MQNLRLWFRNFKAIRRVERHFPGTTIEPYVVIKGEFSNLKLGNGVTLQSGSVLHLGGMPWCENAGGLELGDDAVISPNCVLYGAGPGGIRIGRNVNCGPGVGIFASRTDYNHPDRSYFAPVIIGDNVTIYAHAVISAGVTVGDGAAIAGGSVVTRDVPAYTLVGGAPARVLRAITPPQNTRATAASS